MMSADLDCAEAEFFQDAADLRKEWAHSPILKPQETLAVIEQRRELDGRAINLSGPPYEVSQDPPC